MLCTQRHSAGLEPQTPTADLGVRAQKEQSGLQDHAINTYGDFLPPPPTRGRRQLGEELRQQQEFEDGGWVLALPRAG